jgi:hypothetical protein
MIDRPRQWMRVAAIGQYWSDSWYLCKTLVTHCVFISPTVHPCNPANLEKCRSNPKNKQQHHSPNEKLFIQYRHTWDYHLLCINMQENIIFKWWFSGWDTILLVLIDQIMWKLSLTEQYSHERKNDELKMQNDKWNKIRETERRHLKGMPLMRSCE